MGSAQGIVLGPSTWDDASKHCMSLQEADISWEVLRRIVRDWTGTAAELAEVRRLEGGCINTTLLLITNDGDRAVIKIAAHRVNPELAREAYQLNVLRQHGLPVPEVYACNVANLDNPDSYLLMEFLEGVDLAQAKGQCSSEQYDRLQMHLAELVLSMHGHTASHFCRMNPERSDRFETWVEFYRSVYDPIWAEVEKEAALPVKCRKQMNKIHSKLDRLIQHDDRPRLVHWDIWSTNVLARPDEHGRWWVSGLLDPNCKFAHAEAEIAYMELFHTITPAFLRAYQQAHWLGEGYHKVRKLIYQLYPLLNHVRIFGQEYVKPLLGAIERAGTLI